MAYWRFVPATEIVIGIALELLVLFFNVGVFLQPSLSCVGLPPPPEAPAMGAEPPEELAPPAPPHRPCPCHLSYPLPPERPRLLRHRSCRPHRTQRTRWTRWTRWTRLSRQCQPCLR